MFRVLQCILASALCCFMVSTAPARHLDQQPGKPKAAKKKSTNKKKGKNKPDKSKNNNAAQIKALEKELEHVKHEGKQEIGQVDEKYHVRLQELKTAIKRLQAAHHRQHEAEQQALSNAVNEADRMRIVAHFRERRERLERETKAAERRHAQARREREAEKHRVQERVEAKIHTLEAQLRALKQHK